jgi:hypothetical protein
MHYKMTSPHGKCSVTLNLTTTNLSLGDRPDPDPDGVEHNVDYAYYPEDASIVRAVVSENDSEDDATQVSGGTDDSREDA